MQIQYLENVNLLETTTGPSESQRFESTSARPHIIRKYNNMSSTGIAVGLNRGFPVTKRVMGARPSNNKAVSTCNVHETNCTKFIDGFCCLLFNRESPSAPRWFATLFLRLWA